MKSKKFNKALVPYISLLSIALVVFIVFMLTRYNKKHVLFRIIKKY